MTEICNYITTVLVFDPNYLVVHKIIPKRNQDNIVWIQAPSFTILVENRFTALFYVLWIYWACTAGIFIEMYLRSCIISQIKIKCPLVFYCNNITGQFWCYNFSKNSNLPKTPKLNCTQTSALGPQLPLTEYMSYGKLWQSMECLPDFWLSSFLPPGDWSHLCCHMKSPDCSRAKYSFHA